MARTLHQGRAAANGANGGTPVRHRTQAAAAAARSGAPPCAQCRLHQPANCTAAYGGVVCRSVFSPECQHGPFCARCRRSIAGQCLPSCVCRALIGEWREMMWPAGSGVTTSGAMEVTTSGAMEHELSLRLGSYGPEPAPMGPSLPPIGPSLPGEPISGAIDAAIGPAMPPMGAGGPAAAAAACLAAAQATPDPPAAPVVIMPEPPRLEPEPCVDMDVGEPKFKRPWAGTDDSRPKVRMRSSVGEPGSAGAAAPGGGPAPMEGLAPNGGARPKGRKGRRGAKAKGLRITAGASDGEGGSDS